MADAGGSQVPSDAKSSSNATPMGATKTVQLTELEKLEINRVRLEKEQKELQKELQDTQEMNDNLLLDLNNKDIFLISQEAYLKLLSEKNGAEIQQLEAEHTAIVETYTHDIYAHERNVHRLTMHRERFNHLSAENHELTEVLYHQSAVMAQEGVEHAQVIHDMNRDLGEFRRTLERKLRSELTVIEETYQSAAFLNLTEREKEEIFENTKLKDEVALQGVGLANLSLRLNRQKTGTERCRKEQQMLNKKARALREKLNELQITKRSRTKVHAALAADLDALRSKRDSLQSQVNSLSDIHALESALAADRCEMEEEIRGCRMWKSRLEGLHELHVEMKPVDSNEKEGQYNAACLMFEKDADMTSSSSPGTPPSMHSGSSTVTVDASESQHKLSLSAMEGAISSDRHLAQALLPLKGKESLCIASMGRLPSGDESANIAGWVLTRILGLWKRTNDDRKGDSMVQGSWDAASDINMDGIGMSEGQDEHFGWSPSVVAEECNAGWADIYHAESPIGLAPSIPTDVETPAVHSNTIPFSGLKPDCYATDLDDDLRPVNATTAVRSTEVGPDYDQGGLSTSQSQHDISEISPRESREHIETLWDQPVAEPPRSAPAGYTTSSTLPSSAPWYRKVPSAKRFPATSLTTSSSAAKLFTHDPIRPIDISYRIVPPAAFGSARDQRDGAGSTVRHSLSASLSTSALGSTQKTKKMAQTTNPKAAGHKVMDSLKQPDRIMHSSSGTPLQRVLSAPHLSPIRTRNQSSGGPEQRESSNQNQQDSPRKTKGHRMIGSAQEAKLMKRLGLI